MEGTDNRHTRRGPILLVDDDESIRDTMALVLESEGYQVHTADNGRTALELLATMPRPSLILLDLMMPVMNGWEFMEALEATPLSTVPVVVVTAFGDRTKPAKARQIIHKPMDLTVLLDAVRQHSGAS